jgi:uncharacterized protein (TIGR03083 family)
MAEPVAKLLNDQRSALLGVLTNIGTDDWQRPTICDPWTVHDIGAHLVENELHFGRVYRGETDEVWSDNAEAVERWRRVDGDTVRYSLWHHGQATQRVIDSRPDDSWGREVTHSGWPIDLRRALKMQFFELTVHSHDLTSALGAEPIWGDRMGPLVAYCVELAPLALGLMPPEGAVALDVEGVGSYTLDGSAGEWAVTAGQAGAPSAAWHTDPETLVLAVTGRVPIPDALGRTKVEGDAGALTEVLGSWQLAR